ncbi:hypothetical protein [Mobiluncus mulieris]|uniref:Uncharacterized protein n=2 Tax=Mobiluncus mulieris TaxID=2052 RepID=E0QNZ5_9ACTO|nr:hypothetical protein [Mobiluncus mulieris]EEJ52947.1 hypothetical protein HMPREF0577_2260 [Mobiluncus mulieris ATCC 35243]EFM46728.1 hypothetical protein HMPREF0580_0609 [Mobiluncus mulieris ATCC 35239]MCU9976143.1 cell surface protein [Mobiluncus mulieris]MCU9994552.1 cell surface protein [Mobiluncus mulieris]MCU9996966.1 cell surface protein [Mobiluncus mulieris]
MSLFEYDQGHLIPAQFGHAVGREAQGEVLESVRNQVLEVISRPLFPVTWNDLAGIPVAGMPPEAAPGYVPNQPGHSAQADASTPPSPTPQPGQAKRPSQRLTALDGSGQVVLVEVIEKLDAQTLIESLARLGAVSNLGWNDLASAYPGGVAAFRSGWTQFRDAMPPNLNAGPRLILVAAEIDPGVRPALDALTISGLEVHHVSVREMSNGRRFLDVQRVAASLFSRDTNLLSGRAARLPVLTSGVAADFSSGIHEAPLADPGAAVNPPSPVSTTPTGPDSGSGSESRMAPHEPATENHPAPVEAPELQTGTISRHSIMESAKSSPVSPFASGEEEQPVQSLFPVRQNRLAGAAEFEASPTPPEGTPTWQQTGVRHRPRRAAENGHVASVSEENFVDSGEPLAHDPAGLRAIAQVTGESTPIFATVESGSGTACEIQATLLERGVIILEGRECDDPREAGLAVGITEVDGDGWDWWHIGLAQGPTLAEACEEINAELRRNDGA